MVVFQVLREEMDHQPLASKNAGDSIVPWCKVGYNTSLLLPDNTWYDD
jgi:hypothetical protein